MPKRRLTAEWVRFLTVVHAHQDPAAIRLRSQVIQRIGAGNNGQPVAVPNVNA
ncbi:MAG TPA: hypothetical protein P5163_03620 [Rubrivivax sp.]|nr:hypothetical protein [Pseudomonadota bacterium]HRZ59656.1 hypothetical protein [Rubrivivax sp.]